MPRPLFPPPAVFGVGRGVAGREGGADGQPFCHWGRHCLWGRRAVGRACPTRLAPALKPRLDRIGPHIPDRGAVQWGAITKNPSAVLSVYAGPPILVAPLKGTVRPPFYLSLFPPLLLASSSSTRCTFPSAHFEGGKESNTTLVVLLTKQQSSATPPYESPQTVACRDPQCLLSIVLRTRRGEHDRNTSCSCMACTRTGPLSYFSILKSGRCGQEPH